MQGVEDGRASQKQTPSDEPAHGPPHAIMTAPSASAATPESEDEVVFGDKQAVYQLVRASLHSTGFMSHHTEMWDYFIHATHSIVRKHGRGTVYLPPHYLQFSFVSPQIGCPSIWESDDFLATVSPHEAIFRRRAYSSPLFCTILTTYYNANTGDTKVTRYRNQLAGWFPMMVGSSMCFRRQHNYADPNEPWDEGGYFITENGSEKIICPTDTRRTNFIFVFRSLQPRYSYFAEIRPKEAGRWRSASTLYVGMLADSDLLCVRFNFAVKTEVPMLAMFRMLCGEETVETVTRRIVTAGCTTGRAPVPKDHAWWDPELYHKVKSLLRAERGQTCFKSIRAQYKQVPDVEQMTPEEIMEWVSLRYEPKLLSSERRREVVRNLLVKELFPNIGTQDRPANAAVTMNMLAYMAWRVVVTKLGRLPADDMDDFAFRAVESSTHRVMTKFSQEFRGMVGRMKKEIKKTFAKNQFVSIPDVVKLCSFSGAIADAMSSGNFAAEKNVETQVGSGVTQTLSRSCSFVASIRELRMLHRDLPKSNKQTEPRNLHPTASFYICPSNTSEGEMVGIANNFAATAKLTCGAKTHHTHNILKRILPELEETRLLTPSGITWSRECKPLEVNAGAWEEHDRQVFARTAGGPAVWYMFNGVPIGLLSIPEARAVVAGIRAARRADQIFKETTVYLHEESGLLYVDTNFGGFRRPLVVTETHGFTRTWQRVQQVLSDNKWDPWEQLRQEGLVEYVDPLEERNLTVRMSPLSRPRAEGCPGPFTHCNLHPATMFSDSPLLICIANANQSPRITFASCMMRGLQAMMLETYNRATSLTLYTLQQPLVSSMGASLLGMDELPYGMNMPYGIRCANGSNMEDSLILNRDVVQRGAFWSSVTHCITTEVVQSKGTETQRFMAPPPGIIGKKHADYSKLEEDGFPSIGKSVQKDDVVVGKVCVVNDPRSTNRTGVLRDQSLLCKQFHSGTATVTRVMKTRKTRKQVVGVVQMVQLRTPDFGSKFSTRHGQKGTVGAILPGVDMPFTDDGVPLAFIANPHGITSRMTMGQYKESALSHIACKRGKVLDGTVFSDDTQDLEVEAELRRAGCPNGEFHFIDGTSGHRDPHASTMGYLYVMCLRQQARDKIHVRTEGQVNTFYRQPVQGRAHGGGLKLGTMENQCLQANGASAVLLDRLLNCSDAHNTCVCAKCGLLCEVGKNARLRRSRERESDRPFCRNCRSHEHVYNVRIPYATVIYLTDLLACMIAPRLILETDTRVSVENSASMAIPVMEGAEIWRPRKKRRVVLLNDTEDAATAVENNQQQPDPTYIAELEDNIADITQEYLKMRQDMMNDVAGRRKPSADSSEIEWTVERVLTASKHLAQE